jgi:hypothetical protein
VLADLSQVQDLGGVASKTVYHALGYGYEIKPSEHAASLREQAKEFLDQHEIAIDEVVTAFGELSPAMLELASTLVFAFREGQGKLAKDQLIQCVKKIKPRFTTDEIQAQWDALNTKGYLAL